MKIQFYFKRSFIPVFFFAVLFCGQVNAKNYYFSSSSGNDSYTSVQAQNPATPWATISKLNSFFINLNPGDSVLFKCGDTFYGEIIVGKSGLAGSPIVMASYSTGAKPIITGFSSVTAWTNLNGNIWESNSAVTTLSALNMLTVNGSFQAMGRWPKLNDATYLGGWLTTTSNTWAGGSFPITGSVTGACSGSVNYTGGEVVMRKNHWIIDRATITSQSYSSGNTTVNFSQHASAPHFSLTAYSPTNG
ncbi:MAG TPA: hypothetical protein VET23_03635, partial [Chitinophagaceae bacterium]|nr:hypothetical protein [Chitinophagaceae bacterium]